MKALILAAGYATRLGELTRNRAKPLLPIAGRPIVDHLMAHLDRIPAIDGASLVTNSRFAPDFAAWAAARATETGARLAVDVIDDGTSTDETKRGAVGDILHAVEETSLADDLLVVAGDNLFDFDLGPFVERFQARGTTVGLYDVGRLDLMPHYSEVRLDANGQIVHFVEKPRQPTSTLMAVATYLYQAGHLPWLRRYRDAGGNMDSPGHFPAWLYRQAPVYGYLFQGRFFDIGTPDQYHLADQEWRARQ
ncbi:MAG: nucleotidyltransferase family protein [Chloroflexi bacterium]|nr:nucleotidyltransferase family protein [Chloroflexota bacterium]